MSNRDHLGEFEQLALLAVLRLGDDAYGARIQEELDLAAGREVSVSTIYITLMRLEGRGLVSSRRGEPTQVRGGKARRYFNVERSGLVSLYHARAQLVNMWSGVEEALDAVNAVAHEG
jgi:DNA-binding PadR family transcriptional regulator